MSLSPGRLRRLVSYRERLERLQEMALAAALSGLADRERALADARDERRAAVQAAPTGHPADVELRVAYLRRATREISAREAAVAFSRSEVERERARLQLRSAERKAMETLLEKSLAAARLARARAESQRLDDVAMVQWRLKVPAGEPAPGEA